MISRLGGIRGLRRGGGEGGVFLAGFEERVGRADDEQVRLTHPLRVFVGVVDAGEEAAHGSQAAAALVVAFHDVQGRARYRWRGTSRSLRRCRRPSYPAISAGTRASCWPVARRRARQSSATSASSRGHCGRRSSGRGRGSRPARRSRLRGRGGRPTAAARRGAAGARR